MNRNLPRRIDGFFFAPAPALPLALCRAIFCGWLFLWYFSFDFVAVAHQPELLWQPLWPLRIIGVNEIPSPLSLQAAQWVWKASLLAACLGLATRTSLAVACVMGGYLLALTHSFQKINHSDAGLVLALGVLALSRSGDAVSLDSVLRRLRGRGDKASPRPPSGGEYRWPMVVVQSILVIAMFNAGISKLLEGKTWIASDNLHTLLALCQLSRDVPLEIDLELPGLVWICRLAAIGTVVVEILAPLALVNRFLRPFLILGLLGMQLGIYLLMGDNFSQFMALYIFWLPWTPILAWMGIRFGDEGRQDMRDAGAMACANPNAGFDSALTEPGPEFDPAHSKDKP